MPSYIEITILLNFSIHYLSINLGCAFTSVILSRKTKLFYALMTSFFGSVLFFEGSLSVILFLEILFYLKYFYHHYEMYLAYLGIRLLHILSLMKILQGSVHNLLFFPNIHQKIGWILFIHSLILVCLSKKWRLLFSMRHYIYEVEINGLLLKGYLDSGNCAMHEGLPIVVVRQEVYDQLEEEESLDIKVHTITNKGIFKGKKVMFCFKSCPSRPIFVIASEHLLLNVDCLLNMKGAYME